MSGSGAQSTFGIEFRLDPIEDITPWGKPDELNLSWFALTSGHFHMRVGDQNLYQYTEAVCRHWGGPMDVDADYQLAMIASDILDTLPAAIAKLSEPMERLVQDRALMEMIRSCPLDHVDDDTFYNSFRWLGERSPCTGYFVGGPRFYFVRIADNVHIRWDNRNRKIEGIPIWTADYGEFALPVSDFIAACHKISDRLVAQMAGRIDDIAGGKSKPKIPLDIAELRRQHESWIHTRFGPCFSTIHKPDVAWPETEAAIQKIANKCGITLPW